ncbi:LamG-like jellyroll fold domain-containing protein [Planctomycetota bacterium]
MSDKPLTDNSLLYNTFRVVSSLGKGGMGEIFKVKAEPDSKGYTQFLASIIAWEEVMQHEDLQTMRLQIAAVNRDIRKVLAEETDCMDKDDEDRAEELREIINEEQEKLQAKVDNLKTKQQYYIDRRSTDLTETNPEAMTKHITTLNLNYPEDHIFAMKRVLTDDEKSKHRLQDEFKSLKLLDHENILNVYDYGDDYYIMEYLSDTVPPEAIVSKPDREENLFTNRSRIEIIIETAYALEYTHVLGMTHMDVKPENIAVDKEGFVTLIDFGLVRSFETSDKVQKGVVVGTPNYMCLEQIKGIDDSSPTFDIYALGGSLYTYITGEMPYSWARNRATAEEIKPLSDHDILKAVCHKNYQPVPPSEIASGIPQVLEDIIMKALAKNQDMRYQSVSQLRDDLEKYLDLADEKVLNAPSYFGLKPEQINMRVRRRKFRSIDSRSNPKKSRIPTGQKVALGIIIAALILFVMSAFFYKDVAERISKSQGIENPSEVDIERVKKIFLNAEEYLEYNPDNFTECTRKFTVVVKEGMGTDYEKKARTRIAEIRKNLKAKEEQILAKLDAQARLLINNNDYGRSISLFKDYTGPLSQETERERKERILTLEKQKGAYLAGVAQKDRKRREEDEKKRAAQEKEIKKKAAAQKLLAQKIRKEELPKICEEIVEKITFREYKEAVIILNTYQKTKKYDVIKKELSQLSQSIMGVVSFYKTIYTYFRENSGKTVSIQKKTGSAENGVLKGIKKGNIILEKEFSMSGHIGYAQVKIPLSDVPFNYLLYITGIKLDTPERIFAGYLEARSRENIVVQEKLSAKLKNHILYPYFRYVPPQTTEIAVAETDNTAEPEKDILKDALLNISFEKETVIPLGMGFRANDVSGKGHHALAEFTEHTQGFKGWVSSFTNPQGILSVKPSPSLDVKSGEPLTIAFWVKCHSINPWKLTLFIKKGIQRNANYWVGLDKGGGAVPRKVVFGYIINNRWNFVRNASDHVFTPGVWTHVAVTADPGSSKINFYINGSLESSVSDNLAYIPNKQQLIIGNSFKKNTPLTGEMDDIMIFKKCLSLEDIKNIHRITQPTISIKEIYKKAVLHLSMKTNTFVKRRGLWHTADMSGHKNHAAIHGAKLVQRKNRIIVSFDGVDDYMEIQNSPELSPAEDVTVSVCLRWKGPAGHYEHFIAKNKNNHDQQYEMLLGGNGNITWTLSNYGPVIKPGIWHHIAGTFNKKERMSILYINGERASVRPNLTYSMVNNNEPLHIGARNPRYGWFKGDIAEVFVFPHALETEEIHKLYLNSIANPDYKETDDNK